jgi:hypothetical protein
METWPPGGRRSWSWQCPGGIRGQRNPRNICRADGPHWELQNGLLASSVSAWCGVAGDGARVGGEFLGSACGLWVVSCGNLWPVRVSWFMERRPICPENAGARWKKRAIVPHSRHHPVLLLRPGRPAVPLQRAHFAGGAVVACHFLATAYQRQGTLSTLPPLHHSPPPTPDDKVLSGVNMPGPKSTTQATCAHNKNSRGAPLRSLMVHSRAIS